MQSREFWRSGWNCDAYELLFESAADAMNISAVIVLGRSMSAAHASVQQAVINFNSKRRGKTPTTMVSSARAVRICGTGFKSAAFHANLSLRQCL